MFKFIIYNTSGTVEYKSMFKYTTYNMAETIAKSAVKLGKLAGFDYHHFSVL